MLASARTFEGKELELKGSRKVQVFSGADRKGLLLKHVRGLGCNIVSQSRGPGMESSKDVEPETCGHQASR